MGACIVHDRKTTSGSTGRLGACSGANNLLDEADIINNGYISVAMSCSILWWASVVQRRYDVLFFSGVFRYAVDIDGGHLPPFLL